MNYQSIKKVFILNKALKKLTRNYKLDELYILYAIHYFKGITSSKLYAVLSKVGRSRRTGFISKSLKKLCADGLIKKETYLRYKGYRYYLEAKGLVALYEFEKALRMCRMDRL